MRVQEWLWTGEVAATLGVSTATILRWERDGRIPVATRTLGGSRRWRREVIEALLVGPFQGNELTHNEGKRSCSGMTKTNRRAAATRDSRPSS